MIDDLGINGALREVQDETTLILNDSTQLLLDTIALLARAPTAGRAVSDTVWTTALRDLINDNLPVVNQAAVPPTDLFPFGAPTESSVDGTQRSTIAGLCGGAHGFVVGASLVDVVNYTGAGVLQFLCAGGNNVSARTRVTIDGVVVCDVTNTTSKMVAIVGALGSYGASTSVPDAVTLDAVPFNTSLRIEQSIPSGSAYAAYKWRKTA